MNLLQPQDRRARVPGDSADAVAARRRFLDRGFAAPLVDAMVALLSVAPPDAMLDVGCGEGHHLVALANRFGGESHGIDISLAAIDAAARRAPQLSWAVANADRFVPYAAGSFRVVTSVTARMNAAEFRRVLAPDGRVLVAVPGPEDLVELRRAVLGEGAGRDRVARTVASFAPLFTLERHERIRRVERLDAQAIGDVMTSSYRGLRRREQARLAALDGVDVTLSHDLLVFRAT